MTSTPLADRKKPSHQPDRSSADTAASSRAGQDVDVDRAQQRLTQEIDLRESSLPESSGEALALAKTIREQVTADPQSALQAARRISATLFEAATARPAA